MRVALLSIAAMALLGCAHTAVVAPACLPMRTYDAQTQAALSAANKYLDTAPPAVRDPLREAVKEYITMRAANREACRG